MARCRTATSEQMLAPALRPGDVVIMDDLPAHPVSSTDSPPGNRAEGPMVDSFQEAAERAEDGLWAAIGRLLELFPPADCANHLANSGWPRPA